MFNLSKLNFSPRKKLHFINLYKTFKVASIFLILLSVFFVRYLLKTEAETAGKYFQQSSMQAASNIRGRIDFIINDLQGLSTDLTYRSANFSESDVMNFMREVSLRPGYYRMAFIYPNGKAIRVQKGKMLPTTDWSQDPRFKQAITGKAVFTGTEANEQSTSRYVNKYGVPVYNKQGKIVGIIAALYDSGAFVRVLSYGNYEEKALAYIISNTGDFMLKPARDKSDATNFFDNGYKFDKTTSDTIRTMFKEKKNGVFDFKYNNIRYIASFAKIEGTECLVVTMVPIDVLLLNISRVLMGIVAIVVIVMLAVVVLLYYSDHLFKEHEKIIYDTVFVDSVTKEGNKNKFKLDAKSLLNNDDNTHYAMISIEIKKFKVISELYGEEKANQILKDFFKMIQSNLPKDSICARDYNATFVVLYKYTKEEFILKYFIEKLIDEITIYNEEKMQQTMIDSGIVVSTKLQLAFGVYVIDDKKLPIDQMREHAVTAKKQVKEDLLKPYSFYDNNLKIKLLQKRVIEDEMHSALASGQFHMYLQPKFGLQTDGIAGAEALVRWIHPAKGLIPPMDFIPLFEQNGFVIEIDKCIWKQACEYISRRKKENKPIFPISVNVSRLHLHNDAFINELLSLTSQYEINPKYLELELTETASFDDEKRFNTTIKRLKELGFTIAMDDFGTGYSSLSVLKDLPFDVLKLDRSFVKDATNDQKTQTVIKTMIDLANQLNMVTVAEGIETDEQAELLRGMGCSIAQGFLYGKPMSVVQFEELCELTKEEHY